MKNLLWLCLLLFSTTVAAQLENRYVQVASFSNVSGSGGSYTADLTFESDQTGNGYLANQVQVGWRVLTNTKREYEITAVNSAGISTANLSLSAIEGTTLSPSGVAVVYQYDGTTRMVPPAAVNSLGISAAFSAVILVHNFEVAIDELGGGTPVTTIPADSVTVVDAGDVFSATNLENILTELFNYAVNRRFYTDTLTAIGNATGYVHKFSPEDLGDWSFTGSAAAGYTITATANEYGESIEFIGDSGTTNASGEIVLILDNSANGVARRFSVQIYDLSNDQKVDEHLVGNVTDQAISGTTTTLTIPNVSGNYPGGIRVHLR